MRADPKSIKIQSSHQYLFALLGSMVIKAARKTLVKLTPYFYLFICKLLSERRIKLMKGLTQY